MRSRAASVLLGALAAVTLLGGCAPASAPAPAPTSASATPTPTPTPTPSAPATPAEEAADRLSRMSEREKLAAMLMLHYPGTDQAALADFMRTTGAGGFIVMGDNVAATAADTAAVTGALTLDPQLPPIVGIDQEGGVVSRLDEDVFPSASALRRQAPEATRDAFAQRAALVEAAGVDINFGIVADETADPSSFIADRILGTTPEDAAARVEQAVAGERGKVLSTLKHFPGHGLTDADSHVSLPSSGIGWEDWNAGPAVPFARGIAAGAEAVMFGHLVLTSVDGEPASLSTRWHDILRNDLGFRGLAVTDDMLMLQHSGVAGYTDPLANAIKAINAGNDLLVYVLAADPAVSGVDPYELLDGLEAAVADGRIDGARVDAAVQRLLETRIALRDAG
ncbi:glycoside hydrolase family 3 N-terminal domain-containing protein [Naasia sp. SYSU D00057]|uniref:glycoside hydrolase family 3 N-terminal domain-containing protein n=1 Tax=Naasia sp. SYSU D00057 TaxID=2817380 RepID=UPI001B308F9C|nr:glycoside hydrolase family 3 N-terminal domain-containing protein [Naasia sp. SYSU D00057]